MNEIVSQLPLRKRGTLEIFDVSFKLYKRYFAPIFLWSVICGLAGMAGAAASGIGIFSFLLTPFLIGAVGCSVAAAVHGRDVTIKDCWKFSSKRYGAILHVYFICGVLGFLMMLGGGAVLGILIFGGSTVLKPLGAGSAVFNILGIILIIVLGLILSAVYTCIFAWMQMVPLALCLEGDGKDNMRFLRRTYDLMRGHWWKIFALVSLIGLAALALLVILGGVATMVQGWDHLRNVLQGQVSDDTISQMLIGYLGTFSLVSIIFTPIFYLALGVQYLDLRVRKEALDLEWAAQDNPAETAS